MDICTLVGKNGFPVALLRFKSGMTRAAYPQSKSKTINFGPPYSKIKTKSGKTD